MIPGGRAVFVYGHLIIGIGARRLGQVSPRTAFHPLKECTGREVAERTFVLKDNQFAGSHFAASRRAVEFEHNFERVPEQLQIILGEAGLRGKVRGDEAVAKE